ncbi:MAG TPA: hypothetical protein DER04_06875, partial [Holosporales bacterium]|nr:hypothetical protein [Holosporales bacterium]HBW24305.1 hypothetical protein [Holosporales bacterium]HCC25047.1 hypothetical protein [Holosporales bacterium]HCE96472.1 hypothetical protein [Holosporales bacterium]
LYFFSSPICKKEDDFHSYLKESPELLSLSARLYIKLHPVYDWQLVLLAESTVDSIPQLKQILDTVKTETDFVITDFKNLAPNPKQHTRLKANFMARKLTSYFDPNLDKEIVDFLKTSYKKLYRKGFLEAPLWGYYFSNQPFCVQRNIIDEARNLTLDFIYSNFYFCLTTAAFNGTYIAYENLFNQLDYYYDRVEKPERYEEVLREFRGKISPFLSLELAKAYDDNDKPEIALEILDKAPSFEEDPDLKDPAYHILRRTRSIGFKLKKAEVILNIPEITRLDEAKKLLQLAKEEEDEGEKEYRPHNVNKEEESDASEDENSRKKSLYGMDSDASKNDAATDLLTSDESSGDFSEYSDEVTFSEGEYTFARAAYLESLLYIYDEKFDKALKILQDHRLMDDVILLTAVQYQLDKPSIPQEIFNIIVEDFFNKKYFKLIKKEINKSKTAKEQCFKFLKKYRRLIEYLIGKKYLDEEVLKEAMNFAMEEKFSSSSSTLEAPRNSGSYVNREEKRTSSSTALLEEERINSGSSVNGEEDSKVCPKCCKPWECCHII